MSVRYENRCVGCPPDLGCMGDSCLNRNVAIPVCDNCGKDIEGEVCEIEGDDLCQGCYEKLYGDEE